MAEQLVDRIHAQVRALVRELELAVRKSEQLEAALAALDVAVPGPAASASEPAAAAP